MHGVQSIASPTGPYTCDCGHESATRDEHDAHEREASKGMRDPKEQKTLADALTIASDLVDLRHENRHAVSDEQYTLAAGFLVLCRDQALIYDAARKAKHFCGWCERANNDDHTGLVPMTLDEVREHTVRCPHNPVVAEVERLRDALAEAITMVRIGHIPERLAQLAKLVEGRP